MLEFAMVFPEETLMNNLFPEIDSNYNRRRIAGEMEIIRLQEEALRGKSLWSRLLKALGEWMVSRGERLRKRHSIPSHRTGSVEWMHKVT